METNDQIHCPKCGSTQVTANKKGFSGGKAAAGAILTGGIGLLAGTIGSKNIVITCLNCGKQFKPGEGGNLAKPITRKPTFQNSEIDYAKRRKVNKTIAKIFSPLFIILAILFFFCDLIIAGVIFTVIGLFFLAMAFAKTDQ